MRKFAPALIAAGISTAAMLQIHPGRAQDATPFPNEKACAKLDNPSDQTSGWCVAITRNKGNCLACHAISVTPWPEGLPASGNIAPGLVAMKQRFPDRAKLREQIVNPHASNPQSVMPPFGRNRILTDREIDQLVEFLLTI